ncbi:hypothetical protein I4U23_012269 [Adineta vaga]|nr:hypothetical protein I4U23_012269 [Adineta vaga]
MSTSDDIPSSSFCTKLNDDESTFFTCSVIFGYGISLVLFIVAFNELYKINTFVLGQCKVKSIDMKFRSPNLYPRWNVTIVDENLIRNYSLIDLSGFSDEDNAWNAARKYQINGIYSCYRSADYSFLQWNKPSKSQFIGQILGGVLFFLTITVLILCRQWYRKTHRNTRQEQREEISLNSRELQTMSNPEIPPPSYQEVMQTTTLQTNYLNLRHSF